MKKRGGYGRIITEEKKKVKTKYKTINWNVTNKLFKKIIIKRLFT